MRRVKLFEDPVAARASVDKQVFIPRICPFTAMDHEGTERVCGDWCPHFQFTKSVIKLTCGNDCIIHLEE